MKYLLYIVIFILIIPSFLGGTMITTMHTYQFQYDTDYNKNITTPNMSMVLLDINPTKIEETKIRFLYDTITYTSPYSFKWILHSKFKDCEIIKSYILVNGKNKIELDTNLISDGTYKDSYIFQTKEQSIEIDVNKTDYIDVILEYRVNHDITKNRYRYNLEYKKETGNRLWWAIMSV